MSRKRSSDDYGKSFAGRFSSWLSGEKDPYIGKLEMKQNSGVNPSEDLLYDARNRNEDKRSEAYRKRHPFVRVLFLTACILVSIAMMAVLVCAVSHLPSVGEAGNPTNNEVPARYIESGLQETGNINIVSGMILTYRAFDTFGESNVLFAALTCVTMVLTLVGANSVKKEIGLLTSADFQQKRDPILQKTVKVIFPIIFLFGIYIVANGHLSPGGGFSGGAILGAALILYQNGYGFECIERFFTSKLNRWICFCALSFYCLSKSYSFYTGANGLHSIIPLGRPGAILSGGLTLPLNICVGAVVACTMYSFYSVFTKEAR